LSMCKHIVHERTEKVGKVCAPMVDKCITITSHTYW